MRYALSVSSAAATDPVTYTEAKAHMRVTVTDDDTYITGLIAAATNWVQMFTARQLVTATLIMTLDGFPYACGDDGGDIWGSADSWATGLASGIVRLPRNPVQSISSVTYVDTAGTTQTLASTVYQLDKVSEVARLAPAYAQYWPAVRPQLNPVAVTFVCGYGAAAAVPDEYKTAIRMLVAHWYMNREPVQIGHIVQNVPHTVEMLLWSQRLAVI